MKYIFALILALTATFSVAPRVVVAQEARTMTHAELMSSASTLLQGMQNALDEVSGLLAQSESEADDAQRTDYLREVVRQVEGFVAVSLTASESLRAASDDPEYAATQYNLVYRSSVRVNQLLSQARGYNGAASRYSDSTVRSPLVDETIPDAVTWLEDTQEYLFDPTVGTTVSDGTDGVAP